MVSCCTDGASVNMGKLMVKVFVNCIRIYGNVHVTYFFYCTIVAMNFFCKVFICEGHIQICLGTQLFERTISFFLAAATDSKEQNT